MEHFKANNVYVKPSIYIINSQHTCLSGLVSQYFNNRVVSTLPELGADFLAGGNLKATQQQILASLLES